MQWWEESEVAQTRLLPSERKNFVSQRYPTKIGTLLISKG